MIVWQSICPASPIPVHGRCFTLTDFVTIMIFMYFQEYYRIWPITWKKQEMALYGTWEGLVWGKILPRGVGTICPSFWEFQKSRKIWSFVHNAHHRIWAKVKINQISAAYTQWPHCMSVCNAVSAQACLPCPESDAQIQRMVSGVCALRKIGK